MKKVLCIYILNLFISHHALTQVFEVPTIEIKSIKNYYIMKIIFCRVSRFDPEKHDLLVYVKKDDFLIKHSYNLPVGVDGQLLIKLGIEEFNIKECIIYILPKPSEEWQPLETITNERDFMDIASSYSVVNISSNTELFLVAFVLLIFIIVIGIFLKKHNIYKIVYSIQKIGKKTKHEIYEFGDNIIIDFDTRLVTRNNKDLEESLTHFEYNLLAFFITNRNRFLSNKKLLEKVFDYKIKKDKEIKNHLPTLRQHVYKLRKKLKLKKDEYIINKQKKGYIFNDGE